MSQMSSEKRFLPSLILFTKFDFYQIWQTLTESRAGCFPWQPRTAKRMSSYSYGPTPWCHVTRTLVTLLGPSDDDTDSARTLRLGLQLEVAWSSPGWWAKFRCQWPGRRAARQSLACQGRPGARTQSGTNSGPVTAWVSGWCCEIKCAISWNMCYYWNIGLICEICEIFWKNITQNISWNDTKQNLTKYFTKYYAK